MGAESDDRVLLEHNALESDEKIGQQKDENAALANIYLTSICSGGADGYSPEIEKRLMV